MAIGRCQALIVQLIVQTGMARAIGAIGGENFFAIAQICYYEARKNSNGG